jgi:putative general porin
MSRSSSPRRLIGAAVGTACAAFAVQADEFSWQLSGGTSRVESGDFSRDSWGVDGTYYVKPIDDSSGPYGLASFLNPTTRVSAAASKVDADFNDPAVYKLSGAFVLPSEKWYVGANYSKSAHDDTPLLTYSNPHGYGVSAGRYLGANTTLELGLGRSEQETSFCTAGGSSGCFGPLVETETTRDSVDLEVFHVRRFRSLTYALQGRVSELDSQSETRSSLPSLLSENAYSRRVYSVATELFPTQRLGVRVGYSRPDGDFDIDSYDVGATWFFKPRVAVQFSLSRTNVDNGPAIGSSHSESSGVSFIGRL